MKCDKCGKKLKPSEEHFIGSSSKRSAGVKGKPGFYCWPCYKEKQRERWTPLLIVIVIFLIICFLIYVLPKLFRTNKKSRRR